MDNSGNFGAGDSISNIIGRFDPVGGRAGDNSLRLEPSSVKKLNRTADYSLQISNDFQLVSSLQLWMYSAGKQQGGSKQLDSSGGYFESAYSGL